jgi:hypothetical protein
MIDNAHYLGDTDAISAQQASLTSSIVIVTHASLLYITARNGNMEAE